MQELLMEFSEKRLQQNDRTVKPPKIHFTTKHNSRNDLFIFKGWPDIVKFIPEEKNIF